ncbi:hypothetical protein BVL54_17600 [Bacillus paralicheniformis]|nr:hypothetical protein BVL54_17600 [Bacillus paralicheniformis]
MTNQERLNRLLDELANEYLKFNAKQQQLAIKEIGRVRLEISDLLSDFSGNDGIIKRQRLNRLLRELDTIEKAVRKNGMDALDKTIIDAAEFTTERIKSAMEETLGKTAVAGIAFDRVNQTFFDTLLIAKKKTDSFCRTECGDLREINGMNYRQSFALQYCVANPLIR